MTDCEYDQVLWDQATWDQATPAERAQILKLAEVHRQAKRVYKGNKLLEAAYDLGAQAAAEALDREKETMNNTINLAGLAGQLLSLTLGLPTGIRFSVERHMGSWVIYERVGGGVNPDIELLDGTKAGGSFPTLDEALDEVRRIFVYYKTPLTRKEIVRHFAMKWMRKEEQADLLIQFRAALLSNNWESARKLAKGFSGYTSEAIPDKVRYHLAHHTDLYL